jgi:hypothetical protein
MDLALAILHTIKYECVSKKFPDWPPGTRMANGRALCNYAQLYLYFVSQNSEICRHNPVSCFSTIFCCCLFPYRLYPEILDKPLYTSRESSVITLTGYGLDDLDSISDEDINCLLHMSDTIWSPRVSLQVGAGISFSGDKKDAA